MKRFQECNKLEKIWRYRWYFAAPFVFIYDYIKGLKIYEDKWIDNKIVHTPKYNYPNTKLLWKLTIGKMQSKMKWYYTGDEVKKRLNERLKKKGIK